MKKAILIILVCLGYNQGHAAGTSTQAKMDSLRRITQQTGISDSVRIHAYYLIGAIHKRRGNYDSAFYYIYRGREESVKVNFTDGLLVSYQEEGTVFSRKRAYNEAVKCWLKALEIAREMKSEVEEIIAYANLGSIYNRMGMPDKSIIYLTKALDYSRRLKLRDREYKIMSNLASTYQAAGNFQKAAIQNQEIIALLEKAPSTDQMAYAAAVNNLGFAQKYMGDYASAAKNYLKAVEFNKKINNPYGFLQVNLEALGMLFLQDTLNTLGKQVGDNRQSLDISMMYLKELESLGLEKKDTGALVSCYLYLSQCYLAKGDPQTALKMGLKGWIWCKKFSSTGTYEEYLGAMGKIYFTIGKFRESAIYYRNQQNYGDSLKKVETAEKVALLSNSLEVEQMNEQLKTKEDQLKESRFITYFLFAITAFILILATILFYFLRQKNKTARVLEQQNREIKKEKDRSESLLLNILPAEVAEELKSTGSSKAKTYSMVSVMFTDFKDFTRISEMVSAELLVSEMNYCYSTFDAILEKYKVEKIKTIGDAYLCASGLPVLNYTHATDLLKAAIEIRNFMLARQTEKEAKGEIPFELRIGIHTGPVVAGIVGVKKFAYDIWGDTVNIAARMEQNSEAGKINISGNTYQLVKTQFDCVYRGKIEAKNKGEVEMYFVNS